MGDAPEVLQTLEPKPEAADRSQVRLSEMMWVVLDEAERIENVQAARVKIGETPNPDMVRRAEVFRKLGNFLFMLEPIMPEIRALLTRPKEGRR